MEVMSTVEEGMKSGIKGLKYALKGSLKCKGFNL